MACAIICGKKCKCMYSIREKKKAKNIWFLIIKIFYNVTIFFSHFCSNEHNILP